MEEQYLKEIVERICPLVAKAELSLLLGAGFSRKAKTKSGTLPDGEELRDNILLACKKVATAKTTLKDAYLYAKQHMAAFDQFLIDSFSVTEVAPWQEKLFSYAWRRIYTTNIDDLLDVAHANALKKNRVGGQFSFLNYVDPDIVSHTIGAIPVISIHGTCRKMQEGFIFSTLEYAKASTRLLDWHGDLAAQVMNGGLVVIGNQLDETDLDIYLAERASSYGEKSSESRNWIVMPSPDDIKAENYRSAGYTVLDCTAEEFFVAVYEHLEARDIGAIVLDSVPIVAAAANRRKAAGWFKNAFDGIIESRDRAKVQSGILRHFLTGAIPEWFYIINSVPAKTVTIDDLTIRITSIMQSQDRGMGILHVTGPSGSGKTTAIRTALDTVSKSFPYIYEFRTQAELDSDLFRDILAGFTAKSIFVFYSAHEYYYAMKLMSDRVRNNPTLPHVLFILEDRTSDFRKSRHHLRGIGHSDHYSLQHLDEMSAERIVNKIAELGLEFPKFSKLSTEKRTRLLLDKERGFGGDLLTALFSLTSHENFEAKIFQEFENVSGLARDVLEIVAIVHSIGYGLPFDYVLGALSIRPADLISCLDDDLAGIVYIAKGSNALRCRHRIIAEYYFKECISKKGDPEKLIPLLEYLSRKFSIDDIRFHPLPYKIYKELISSDFLLGEYFPDHSSKDDAARVYHEAQRFFSKDGIFWLSYGRYYRKVGDLAAAIECFRIGLGYYESFQTRHLLGVTSLELFRERKCREMDLYVEGVDSLQRQRAQRPHDPYPLTGLVHQLLNIVESGAHIPDLQETLKKCINDGLAKFRDDHEFEKAFKRFIAYTNGSRP